MTARGSSSTPRDDGVLIRSTAAGERLGGLARSTAAAAEALAVAFDVVVIETVGVGQAETDVAEVADTVVVVVQPGAGDVLQFLKSGIMEVPDVLVVTKADLGQLAIAQPPRPGRRAALARRPLDAGGGGLLAAPDQRGAGAAGRARAASRRARCHGAAPRARRARALREFVAEHGERGLRAIGGRAGAERLLAAEDPGAEVPALIATLESSLAG